MSQTPSADSEAIPPPRRRSRWLTGSRADYALVCPASTVLPEVDQKSESLQKAADFGTAVVNKGATAKQAAADQGVRGVAGVAGTLPAHQAANAAAISNGLRAHIARMQQAA